MIKFLEKITNYFFQIKNYKNKVLIKQLKMLKWEM